MRFLMCRSNAACLQTPITPCVWHFRSIPRDQKWRKSPESCPCLRAKAAPSYRYAKSVIRLINAVADLVNNDPDCKGKLAVAFLPNYGVSLGERIIPAADISEQISMAGTEASGTSNMKLMANGALTLATLDGANIEIKDAAGEDAMAMFGLTTPEVAQLKASGQYSARAIYEADPTLHRVVDMLTDGTIPGITTEGREIQDELLVYNDTYLVLADFRSYVEASHKLDALWQDPIAWAQAALKISPPRVSSLQITPWHDTVAIFGMCCQQHQWVMEVSECIMIRLSIARLPGP